MKSERNILYILGAGFSAPAGLPTISTFYRIARRLFFTEPEKYRHFEPVFTYLERASGAMNYLDAELFNIEELLSIIEMENVANSDLESEIDVNRFVVDTIRACTPKYEWATPQGYSDHFHLFKARDREDNTLGSYAAFVLSLVNANLFVHRKNNDGRTLECLGPSTISAVSELSSYSVLSFNYDTLIEQIVQTINEQRLSHEHTISVKIPESATDKNEARPTWELSLSKLHGSLRNDQTFFEDAIIAPTSMKAVTPVLVSQWKTAYEKISNADVLIFVGYSFAHGDAYLQYLLKSALKGNIDLQSIIVVNSGDPSEMKERYRSIFPRVQSRVLLQESVSDYIARTCLPSKYQVNIPTVEVGLRYDRHWSKIQSHIQDRGIDI